MGIMNASQLLGLNVFLELYNPGVENKHMADHEDFFIFDRQIVEDPAFFRLQGQRFFAKDMLTAFQSFESDLKMMVGGNGDADRVDVRMFKDILVVGGGLDVREKIFNGL